MLFFTLVDIFCKVLAINNALPKINISIVKLEYFANPGIAFSIPLPQAVILSSTGIIIALFIGLYISTANQKIKIALYTTILGAGSNFIDRLITGHVTDYLIFFNTSAINIADILICIGIGSCAWYYQKADKET